MSDKRVVTYTDTIDKCWPCPHWKSEGVGMSDKSEVKCKLSGEKLDNMEVIPESCKLPRSL